MEILQEILQNTAGTQIFFEIHLQPQVEMGIVRILSILILILIPILISLLLLDTNTTKINSLKMHYNPLHNLFPLPPVGQKDIAGLNLFC